MTTYVTPKKNTAFKFYVAVVDQSNTKLTKANPTIASGDFKVSTDGGAFANLATLPSANPASGRAVMIDLSSGEMNGDNIVVQCVDAAGAEWCDLILNIQTTANQIDDIKTDTAAVKVQTDKLAFTVTNQVDANVLDWKSATAPAMTGDAYARLGAPAGASVSADVAAVKALLPTALTANGNMKSSMVEILTTALTETAGLLAGGFKKFFNVVAPTLTALGVDQTGDSYARVGAPAGASVSADVAAIKAAIPAALTGAGNMKTDALAINGSTNAAANLARGTRATVLGTVTAGSSTTSIVTSSLDPAAAVIDQFKGRIVIFERDTTTTNLQGQATDITGNTALGVLTVTALTDAPVSGDTFVIV